MEAVEHTEGPLLILAGAGSGKTRVLTHRIASLIRDKGVNPWNIMAITFTNKAAGEMRERVDKIVGYGSERIWVSTFHSSCVRILRRHADRLGYANNFAIYDTDDQKSLIKDIMKRLQMDPKLYRDRAIMAAISSAKDEMIEPAAGTLRVADKTVSGEGFSVAFDPKSGFIRSYRLRNVELLAGPVRPNFYRAATDNDLGVRQTGKYPDSRMWAKAEPQLTGFALTPGDSEVKAIADYTLPNVGAKLNLTYSIAADGSVRVSETMTADPARKDVADLMRFGMAFETPGMFDAVEYYGRGPMENYADRSGAAFVGRYAQRVADQFHMKYVSPQESGTRSGLRWWRLTDDSGLGVEICSDRHFSASAIPFAIPQLDNGSPEYVRHPGDLVPDGRTHVNIESVQSGLGCVNSWGRLPRPEYLLPYGDYSFNFLLRPVAGGR